MGEYYGRLPFMPDMAALIMTGDKVCTSRTKYENYAHEGDRVKVQSGKKEAVIRIMNVEHRPLWFVSKFLFRAEGFETPGKFIEKWEEIHPRAGFRPTQKVWVYWFELVKE